MTIVEQVQQEATLTAEHRSYKRDSLTLTWEERRQGHGLKCSDSGVEFAVSLPGGAVLKEGDCLILDAEKTNVMVREAIELVYIIRPKTPQDWARYAYHVGNRHQSIMIAASELIMPQTAAVKSLLDHLHADYMSGARPFTAALASIGHSH